MGCPENIRPFWISGEPVTWPWCNLLANWRRTYCSSVNSHSPVGLVSQQWDGVDWACVLCDRHIHNDRASRSASSWQRACPFYSYRAGFLAKYYITQVCQPPIQPRFSSLRHLAFPKTKLASQLDEIYKCDGYTIPKLSQQHLTADWLASYDSNY
jgi:hypothetical protein